MINVITSWYRRLNPDDQINRKPGDRKNDQTTEKAKNHQTNSTVLNLIFGPLHLVNFSMLIEKNENLHIHQPYHHYTRLPDKG